MKKRLLVLAVFLFSPFSSWATKVGKVNLQQIFFGIDEGRVIREKVKNFVVSKQMDLKKEEEKVIAAQKNFQKKSLVMSEKTKIESQNKLKNMIIGLNKKKFMLEKEVQKFGKDLRRPIENKLKEVIDKISKAEGVDLTFEVASGQLVYAKTQVDITAKVIKAYNKAYPVKKK